MQEEETSVFIVSQNEIECNSFQDSKLEYCISKGNLSDSSCKTSDNSSSENDILIEQDIRNVVVSDNRDFSYLLREVKESEKLNDNVKECVLTNDNIAESDSKLRPRNVIFKDQINVENLDAKSASDTCNTVVPPCKENIPKCVSSQDKLEFKTEQCPTNTSVKPDSKYSLSKVNKAKPIPQVYKDAFASNPSPLKYFALKAWLQGYDPIDKAFLLKMIDKGVSIPSMKLHSEDLQ